MTSTSESLVAELAVFAALDLGGHTARLRRVSLAAGEELCRQGEAADALYVIESGSVAVAARLPGGREVDLAHLGPGAVVGELALLDGGVRTATVRALEPTRTLRLTRRELVLLISREDGSGRTVRRRLTELACRRLRERHRALAASLDGQPVATASEPGEVVDPPAPDYLGQLPFFRGYERDALDDLLARSRVERVQPGAVLVGEGEPARALFVTLNGAVEEAIRRGRTAIRVALAGPGRGFGYTGLIVGGTATATAAARERSTFLVVDAGPVEELLQQDAFATAVERDLVAALRQAERPQARLAASAGLPPAR